MSKDVVTLRQNGDAVDWHALSKVMEAVGFGWREPALLAQIFAGSFAVCFAYEGDKLVGAARAISDGVRSSAIYDVVVLPESQGHGIGRRIMEDLLARLPSRSVLLLSVPAQCPFYEKLGFRMLKTAMVKHEDPTYFIQGGYME